MRISSVREFRDQATGLLRSKDPILVTRRGRLAGIFFPTPGATLPMQLKQELFSFLGSEIKRQVQRRGLTERDIQSGFESWRKTRRAIRRRR